MQVSLFLSVTLPGSTICMYVLTYGNYVMHISVCLFSHIDMFNGCCDCVASFVPLIRIKQACITCIIIGTETVFAVNPVSKIFLKCTHV